MNKLFASLSMVTILIVPPKICLAQSNKDSCEFISKQVEALNSLVISSFKIETSELVDQDIERKFKVYKYQPEKSLTLYVVVTEDGRKIISNAILEKKFLLKNKINKMTIKHDLGIRSDQSLPTSFSCDMRTVKLSDTANLSRIEISSMID